MTNLDTPKKKHGCFFYGCITSLILLLIFCLSAFFGVRYAIHRINAVIIQYTDTQPLALPKEEIPEAEMKELQARFKTFQDAIAAHSNTPPLVLTGREINGLLVGSPEMKELRNWFHVDLDGDQIKGQVSLPLEKFFKIPYIDTKGRYLNGAGVFKVGLTNNELSVRVNSLEVKGQPLPEQYMSQIRNQNFADSAEKDPTNAAAIRRYETIEVKDGKLIITPKKPEQE